MSMKSSMTWSNPKWWGRWALVLWPFVLTLWGVWYFQVAIREMVESTPHPELVYVQLVVFAVAVWALMVSTSRYNAEQRIADWLGQVTAEERRQWLESEGLRSEVVSVYRLAFVSGHSAVQARRVAIQQELNMVEERLFSRLGLPNFLAGAQVGLGLVGTFVGLLGTLADLGALFSALGSSAGGDAGALFGDMVAKLQAPMRGMGTSFVASLYGLTGSLIIGLMTHTVRRVGQQALGSISHTVEQAVLADADEPPAVADPQGHMEERWWLTQERQNARLETTVTLLQQQVEQTAQWIAEARKLSDRPVQATLSWPQVLGLSCVLASVVVGALTFGAGLWLPAVGGAGQPALAVAPVPAAPVVSAPAASAPPSPSDAMAHAATPQASPAPAAPRTVEVQPGQSLSRIAAAQQVSLSELLKANPKLSRNADLIRPGQSVRLPEHSAPAAQAGTAP